MDIRIPINRVVLAESMIKRVGIGKHRLVEEVVEA
jgi:hypothetical protein